MGGSGSAGGCTDPRMAESSSFPADDGARRILVCAVPFVTQHSFARFDRPGETTVGFTAGMKKIHDTFDAWLEANANPRPTR